MLTNGLNFGKNLGALSGLMLFTLGAGTVSHHVIHLFSVKVLTRFCKPNHLLSPISSTGVACTFFTKKVPISTTAFLIALFVDMKEILVDCGKTSTVSADRSFLIFGIYTLYTRQPFMTGKI